MKAILKYISVQFFALILFITPVFAQLDIDEDRYMIIDEQLNVIGYLMEEFYWNDTYSPALGMLRGTAFNQGLLAVDSMIQDRSNYYVATKLTNFIDIHGKTVFSVEGGMKSRIKSFVGEYTYYEPGVFINTKGKETHVDKSIANNEDIGIIDGYYRAYILKRKAGVLESFYGIYHEPSESWFIEPKYMLPIKITKEGDIIYGKSYENQKTIPHPAKEKIKKLYENKIYPVQEGELWGYPSLNIPAIFTEAYPFAHGRAVCERKSTINSKPFYRN